MQEQRKRMAICIQVHTNKYINTNNNIHEANPCMRMHIYKRSQKTSVEGEKKNLPFLRLNVL